MIESGDDESDISDNLQKKINDTLSLDMEIVTIVTQENPLATLNELDTIYSLADIYDMLEIIALQAAIREEQTKKAKQQQ